MSRIEEIRARCERDLKAPSSLSRVEDREMLYLCDELSHKDEEIKKWRDEAQMYKTLRLDADRIREGLMQKESILISKNMALEKKVDELTAELEQYRQMERDSAKCKNEKLEKHKDLIHKRAKKAIQNAGWIR